MVTRLQLPVCTIDTSDISFPKKVSFPGTKANNRLSPDISPLPPNMLTSLLFTGKCLIHGTPHPFIVRHMTGLTSFLFDL